MVKGVVTNSGIGAMMTSKRIAMGRFTLLVAWIAAYLVACSGKAPVDQQNSEQQAGFDDAQAVLGNVPMHSGFPETGWPALPQDTPGVPETSHGKQQTALGEIGLPGSSVFAMEQATVHIDLDDLTCTLSPPADELSWAMYQFSDLTPADAPFVVSVRFAGDLPPGPSYIGVSDYGRNRWNWTANATSQSDFAVAVDSSQQPVSATGNIYVLVGAWDGVALAVREAALELDAGAPPPQGFAVEDSDGVAVPAHLSWIDPAISFDPDGAGPEVYSYDGVEVKRATSPAGPWESIVILQAGVTTFDDQATLGGLPSELGPYYYEIRTLKQSYLSPWSYVRLAHVLLAINTVKAVMSLSPLTGGSGVNVTLNGSASIHSGALKWIVWDFDGNGVWDLSTEPSLTTTHIYPTRNRYYPRLKLVMDTGGSTMTDIVTGYLAIDDYRGDWSQSGRNAQHSSNSPIRGPRTSANRKTYSSGSIYFREPSIGADGTVHIAGSDNYLYLLKPDLTFNDKYNLGGSGFSTPAIDVSNYIWMSVQYTLFDRTLTCIYSDHTVHKYPPTLLTGEPVVSANGLFVYAPAGNVLYCATPFPAGGSKTWYFWSYSVPVGDEITTPAVVSDGSVYFSAGVSLYKVSPLGALVWKKSLPSPPGPPVIAGNGNVYIPVGSNLFAFSPSGVNLWADYSLGNHIVGAPAVGTDGNIYLSTDQGRVYAYSPLGYRLYTPYEDPGAVFVTPPALEADGRVYVVSQAGTVYCLTKKLYLSWSYPLGEPCSNGSIAIGNNGMLYVGGVKKLTGFQ